MNTQHQPSDYNDTHEIPEDELSLTTLFRAGGSLYGLDSSLVREVVRAGDITRVYDAPPDILGVRNLRGRIVTIVDMGIHLGTEASRRHRDNRLILIDHDGDTYGFLVDAVLEAVSPDPGELMPPTGTSPPHSAAGFWGCGVTMVKSPPYSQLKRCLMKT